MSVEIMMAKDYVLALLLSLGVLWNVKQVEPNEMFAYHLNKNFDLRQATCLDCPDNPCVYAEKEFEVPDALTVCYRYKAEVFTHPSWSWAAILDIGYVNKETSKEIEGLTYGPWETGDWMGYKTNNMTVHGWIGLGEKYIELQVWHHMCLALDFKTGKMIQYDGGRKTFEDVKPILVEVKEQWGNTFNYVTVGCRPDALPDEGHMSMHGMVADFQLFDHVISEEDMHTFTSCNGDHLEGNIISWKRQEWLLKGRPSKVPVKTSVDIDTELCEDLSNSSLHLIPITSTFVPEAVQTCERLSTKVATFHSEKEFNAIGGYLLKPRNMKATECSHATQENHNYYRIGLVNTRNGVFGPWRDYYTNKTAGYLPWNPNRPWDGTQYTTAQFVLNTVTHKMGIVDAENQIDYCFICKANAPTIRLKIRGLCEQSQYDRDYIFNLKDGVPILLGIKTSVITFDPNKESWVWFDRKDNGSSLAVIPGTKKHIPIGKLTVDFRNVYEVGCKEDHTEAKQIKFTTCKKGQFTCNDGQCIDIERRCDQTANCADESDEDFCSMIVMKDNYKKTIAPFKFDEINKVNIPVNVNVSIVIRDILKITEIENTFTLKLSLMLEWYDHRMKYINLKRSISSNALSREEINAIWIPLVIFQNTEANEATKATDETEMTITREGDFEASPDTIVEEINTFEGNDNKITFQQVLSKIYKCEYKLLTYPFDTQICSVQLAVRELDKGEVQLTPDQLMMESNTVLTQYVIQYWKIGYINPLDKTEGVQLVIVLKRRIMNAVLTIYLPTVLILAIVYATNFFKPFFFEAVVTVNLTSLLVLTTLFISVSDSLPPTAYVKMIDIWLIVAQIVPFFEVLLHTFIDVHRFDGDRVVNHHGKEHAVGTGEAGDDENDKKASNENVLPIHQNFMNKRNGSDSGTSSNLIMNNQEWGGLYHLDESIVKDTRRRLYELAIPDESLVYFGVMTSRVLIPLGMIVFSLIYWSYGLFYYLVDQYDSETSE